tara:strand:- start:1552 stop:2586 length:1035 start_codon:yes stop_codon:yes gene_type:complete
MPIKNTSNEINILETILVIWKKKWNIASIVTVALVLVLFYQKNYHRIDKITVKTEIRPITHYEEARYKTFNSFVRSIKRAYSLNDSFRSSEYIFKSDEFKLNNYNVKNSIDTSYVGGIEDLLIDNIDKRFLFNLFYDKLKQNQFLAGVVKKSNFIEEKNYATSLEYNKAVTDLVSQIKLFGVVTLNLDEEVDEIFIQIKTNDLNKWENFLKLIEEEANIEIQKNLSKIMVDYLYYLKKIRLYTIQDIDFRISIATQAYEIVDLEKAKKILINSSEYIRRMENVYSESPISQSTEFHAAKINYIGSNFEKENRSSTTQMLIATGIFSAIFGIFSVLISNAIKNRK